MGIKQFSKKYSIWSFKQYSPTRWVAYIATIIFVLQCFMFFFQPADPRVHDDNIFVNIWIKWFGFFTIQSNLIVGVYVIWYWINPKSKGVNGNFLPYMVSYITITFTLYSALLLPAAIRDGSVDKWGWVGYATNILQHYLVPISAIVFYFVYLGTCKQDFNKPNNDFPKSLLLGMIYPLCYVLYAILLPFMSAHQYSVYGEFTNLDPKCSIGGNPGGPAAWIYIGGAIAGFILVISLYRLGLFSKKHK